MTKYPDIGSTILPAILHTFCHWLFWVGNTRNYYSDEWHFSQVGNIKTRMFLCAFVLKWWLRDISNHIALLPEISPLLPNPTDTEEHSVQCSRQQSRSSVYHCMTRMPIEHFAHLSFGIAAQKCYNGTQYVFSAGISFKLCAVIMRIHCTMRRLLWRNTRIHWHVLAAQGKFRQASALARIGHFSTVSIDSDMYRTAHGNLNAICDVVTQNVYA